MLQPLAEPRQPPDYLYSLMAKGIVGAGIDVGRILRPAVRHGRLCELATHGIMFAVMVIEWANHALMTTRRT